MITAAVIIGLQAGPGHRDICARACKWVDWGEVVESHSCLDISYTPSFKLWGVWQQASPILAGGRNRGQVDGQCDLSQDLSNSHHGSVANLLQMDSSQLNTSDAPAWAGAFTL